MLCNKRLLSVWLALFIAFVALTALPLATQAAQVSPDGGEMKLVLRPDVFADRAAGYQQCWGIVKEVAAGMDIPVAESKKAFKEGERRVIYFDTKNMDLTKREYNLRQRVKVEKDVLEDTSDLTLRYRTSGRDAVDDNAVTASPAYKSKTKTDADVAGFANGKVGKNEGELSVSCTIKNVPLELEGKSLGYFAGYFPTLAKLGLSPDEQLYPINGIVVREYKVSPGELDFGQGVKAGVDISLWLDVVTGKMIAAELSYGFVQGAQAPDGVVSKENAFFTALQERMSNILVPGKMKTRFVIEAGRQ